MQLLVIHDDSALSDNLLQLAKSRIEPIDIELNHISADHALTLHTERQPTLTLFLARLRHDSTAKQKKIFSQAVSQAAKAAASTNTPFIFLSTAAVFSGEQFNYEEVDGISPKTQYGHFYAQLENEAITANPRSVILRTSWLFSHKKNNFLTQVIDYATENKMITVNSAGKGSPTVSSDLARVLLAICLQLPLSDKHFGIYHYCSSDASIGFHFIETILTQAANFNPAINANNILFTHNDAEQQRFFFEAVILNCQKLLDTFGIHQRPWRAAINSTIKKFYDE